MLYWHIFNAFWNLSFEIIICVDIIYLWAALGRPSLPPEFCFAAVYQLITVDNKMNQLEHWNPGFQTKDFYDRLQVQLSRQERV
jgi:hypothetical protein